MAEKTTVTLHWLEKSRAQSFLWLLEECSNVNIDLKTYKRGSDKKAPKELAKIWPLGKSPVVQIAIPGASTSPLTIAESGAIAEYLCEHFAKHLIPTQWNAGKEGQVGGETEEYLRYRYFLHYVEGSLMALMVTRVIVQVMTTGDQIPWLIKPITRKLADAVDGAYFNPNFRAHFGLLEEQLATSPGNGEWLCGTKMTAADFLISFPLLASSKRGLIDKSLYPKLAGYVDRLAKTESYQRAVTRAEEATGEPYVIA